MTNAELDTLAEGALLFFEPTRLVSHRVKVDRIGIRWINVRWLDCGNKPSCYDVIEKRSPIWRLMVQR